MLDIILIVVICLLLGVIAYQFYSNRTRSKQLQQMDRKLRQIMADRSDEPLLIFTADQQLQQLLIAMNELLDYSRRTAADYTKMEISTKKMISNMSHDLRTPLTVILGYLEAIHLNAHMDAEERIFMVSKVYEKTLEILETMNKFFDLSKLEAGDSHIPLSQIQLNEVCRHTILAFYDILTVKHFRVEIDIPDEPIFILGNEDALYRILNNLISNAIKHGGDGLMLGLSLYANQESAVIEVKDRGKGIHEQHIDRIFERLYTLEDSRSSSNHNSGLGLTITKRFVEKMNGTIEVSSPPGNGTVFTVQFNRILSEV